MPARSSRTLRSCVVAFSFLAAGAPNLRVDAAPRSAASEDTRKASEAYKAGTAAFNLGHWDEAVEAWQRGYKLKPDSVFLYNIAQAYRKAGNREQAVFFYKNFLRNTSNAPNRDEVSGWIDQLENEQAAQRQKALEDQKAAEQKAEAQRVAEAARAQREREEARQREIVSVKTRTFDGDLGVQVGAHLWVAGLHDHPAHAHGISPGAAVELSGGYTFLHRGRLRFRLGATVGYSYLEDIGATASFLGFMLDPTVKLNLWRDKLFFVVQVGVGAGLVTGTSSTRPSYLLKDDQSAARGAFVAFEVRPAVGVEYLVVPRLSVQLQPGVVVVTPPSSHFSTEVRVQVLVGVQIHL